MSESWTTLNVLDWTTGRFERAGIPTARLDAQVLLSKVLHCDRVALYANFDRPMAKEELAAYRALIEKRLSGEPVAYLVGTQEFWSLSFDVDHRVLIPRADTETLVSVGLELGDAMRSDLSDDAPPLRALEIATGSGAVVVSLAHERKSWQLVATDLSEGALTVATGNAEKNAVGERIDFRLGDLWDAVGDERFELIVSNPPYVSAEEMKGLAVDVKREPKLALYGGEDGLDIIRRLIDGADEHLEPGGWMALEHGYTQGAAVRGLAHQAGFIGVETRDDLAGRARVTFFQKHIETLG